MQRYDLIKMVENDILHCTDMLNKYSYNKDNMEDLFNSTLFKYMDIIEGIADGLKVISSYEKSSKMADTYRINLNIIIDRLGAFKANDYSNEGLLDLEIVNKKDDDDIIILTSFNEVRINIDSIDYLSSRDKEEITDKIDEIEQIYMKPLSKKAKWEKLRPYIVWTSGKDMRIGMQLINLFLKFN